MSTCAAAAWFEPSGAGQDPQPQPAKRVVRPPEGELLRRAQELSRTAVQHDRLAKLVGKWKLTTRTFADGEVREGKGAVVGQAILGGRYVVLNFQTSVLGRDVEAVQIVGFDTLRNQYTSSWRDNQTTWPVECAGEPGKDADVLTLTGSLRDAANPDGQRLRVVMDLRNEDQVDVQMHVGNGDAAMLMQEQSLRR